jgi:photosystem II stability/assembly factor-like uncharacterized protein
MKMKMICIAVAALGLASCSRAADVAGKPTEKVALVTTAPDGTKLWAVDAAGDIVYFASSGTQHSVSCGKSCTRQVYTPTAENVGPAD